MSDPRIAVFDIGKTNKRLTVFDQSFRALSSTTASIPERQDGDFLTDDVDGVTAWMAEALGAAMLAGPIGVVAVTTHGSTVVHLDAAGERVFPCVSYQQPVSDAFVAGYDDTYGPAEALYRETATPRLGQLLCTGKQWIWLKYYYAGEYVRVAKSLFYPQYLGYLLTGTAAQEISSIGAHSGLWDFHRRDWGSVAREADLAKLLDSPMQSCWEALGELRREGAFADLPTGPCIVAVGVHDSSASLLPYLLADDRPFVLLSTGTWIIAMRPRTLFALQDADLHRDVLYYLDVYGEPVKSSRFMGGSEYDHYAALIRERFPGAADSGGDAAALAAVPAALASDVYVLPTLHPGNGQFPRSPGRIVNEGVFFQSAAFAYAALNLSLAIQTAESLRVLQPDDTADVVLEGGFTKNGAYLGLLAALCPERRFFNRPDTQGTSLGTAICGAATLRGTTPDRVQAPNPWDEVHPASPLPVDRGALRGYQARFLELCRAEGEG